MGNRRNGNIDNTDDVANVDGVHNIEISAVINGRRHTREEVLAWESRRMSRAAAKIGLPAPTGSLRERRAAFAEEKLALGDEGIRRRLAKELKVSDPMSRGAALLSRGTRAKRAMSVCELHVTGGNGHANGRADADARANPNPNAADFVDWFTDTDRPDYERSMIAACPDHFLIKTAPDGTQEVIETTGGSPLATRFFVDYTDLSSLASVADPRAEVEAAGTAISPTGSPLGSPTGSPAGTPIGGVRHEFRDEPGGFRAHLCVEFPALMAPHMISQHRWHLAVEFSNWIELAFSRSDI